MADDPDRIPTPREMPAVRRPTPGVPDRHLVRDAVRAAEIDLERSKRLAQEAFERRRQGPPASQAPQDGTHPPSVSPDVDRALGKAVRGLLAKLWPALLAAALGTGGAVAARPSAPPDRVDAHGVRLAELGIELERERTERLAELERQRATNEAIACRLRVLASVAKRQSYDVGFAEDLIWLSEYLAERPKAPPMWRTTERCKPLP